VRPEEKEELLNPCKKESLYRGEGRGVLKTNSTRGEGNSRKKPLIRPGGERENPEIFDAKKKKKKNGGQLLSGES